MALTKDPIYKRGLRVPRHSVFIAIQIICNQIVAIGIIKHLVVNIWARKFGFYNVVTFHRMLFYIKLQTLKFLKNIQNVVTDRRNGDL